MIVLSGADLVTSNMAIVSCVYVVDEDLPD